MNHYHIDIPIDDEDIIVIKRDFMEYLHRSGGITITMVPDNDIEDPVELGDVLKRMFIHMLMVIEHGDFRRIH